MMKKWFLFLGATTLAVVASAQDNRTALTFEEALARTMSDNLQVEAIGFEEKAAEYERKAAFGLRLPQVGVTGAYAHLGKDIAIDLNNLKTPIGGVLGSLGDLGINIPPVLQGGINSLLATDWSYNLVKQNIGMVGGTVTLPIYTGGKINAANNAARINEETAYVKGDQTRNLLVTEVVERYYGLSLALNVVDIRRQVVDAVRQHLEDAIALENAGLIARSERLLFDVKLAEAERDLLNAQTQVRTITDALSNTLNTPQEFVPVSPMFILDRIEPVNYYKMTAYDNNPSLKQVELKKELAGQDVILKRSEYFPQVATLGGASFYRYNMSGFLPKWFVGVGVQINIFDGLSREYKYSAAKNTVRQVEALEVKAENDIATLVESLYNELINYRNKLPSLEKSMEFAEEYLRVTDLAFKEGIKAASDVIDAELNLAKTRIEKMETAYMYDLMLAALLEAAGISESFIDYSRRPEAMVINYEEN